MSTIQYKRDLPHWLSKDVPAFITWRLHGSMLAETPAEYSARSTLSDRDKFIHSETLLDGGNSGPLWLKNPEVAQMVCETIERGFTELSRYELHAYVVMANHVHLLITPRRTVALITKELKGVTSRRANLLLGRTGETFWQPESFDRWCRGLSHLHKFRTYIHNNPVKAGLVDGPEKFPWSSAHRKITSKLYSA
jgi:putative transposase